MDNVDLGHEVLVDLSTTRDPYVRLMAIANGDAVAPGSPWVALDRDVARLCCVPLRPTNATRLARLFAEAAARRRVGPTTGRTRQRALAV